MVFFQAEDGIRDWRDWSSDVCSSDLPLQHQYAVLAVAFSPDGGTVLTGSNDNTAHLWDARTGKPLSAPLQHQYRSEERRVGKECRSRWSPYHLKKKVPAAVPVAADPP